MRKMIQQILFSILLISGLFAQFPGEPNDHMEPSMPAGEKGDRGRFGRRERIEEVRIWKMTNYLDLSTDQAIQFFPELKEHEARVAVIFDKQQKILTNLKEKCNDENYNPSDKEIVEILKTYETFDEQLKNEKSDFVKNKLGFLTNKQKVKYIVFDSRFKSHLLRALKEHNKK